MVRVGVFEIEEVTEEAAKCHPPVLAERGEVIGYQDGDALIYQSRWQGRVYYWRVRIVPVELETAPVIVSQPLPVTPVAVVEAVRASVSLRQLALAAMG